MAWDDADLKDWIEGNLGYGEREEKIAEILENRAWKKFPTNLNLDELTAGDPAVHRRCFQCKLLTHPRFLNLKEICFRCRNKDDHAAHLENKLRHFFWYIKEMKRLKKCMQDFENANPEVVEMLRKLK